MAKNAEPASRTSPRKTAPTAPLDADCVPWLLAAALASVGPHAGHLPLWLSLLVGSTLAWRAWLWYRKTALPNRWLLLAVALLGVTGIGWEFRTLFGRDAGVALLALLITLKLLEMKQRRDALVVVMLGFFLLLTHYFHSQSILTGIWLLACTTLLTATLIRLHDRPRPAPIVMRQAAFLLAQSLPFLLILYLLFPRISGPLWGLPQDAYAGRSGLSDSMSPGSLNQLILSGAIAFRVQFSGAPPDKSKLYWRGPVFDLYDGKVWRSRPGAALDTPPVIETSGTGHTYVSTLETHNQRWLLALDVPTTLPPGSRLTSTFEAHATAPVLSRSRFAFISHPEFRVNVLESPLVLHQARQLPAGINPRSRALASEWRTLPPPAIVETALDLFRQKDFYYTLHPPLLGENAMDDFLFSSRRGFCEHYASAFVFLMRSAGIPARVVTGYQGGEINPVDGFMVVRQSDAHAWAEVWLAGRGWVRIDPTAAVAPSRIESGIAAALPEEDSLPLFTRMESDWVRQLFNRWDAANNAWNQWVLGYNPQRQRELLSRLGMREPDWRSMTVALTLLCTLVLLAVLVWAMRVRRPADPAQRAWQKIGRRLERLGIKPRSWEGPADLAERVAAKRPGLAAWINEAAGHYIDLRYGQAKPDQLQKLQQCAKRQAPTTGNKD